MADEVKLVPDWDYLPKIGDDKSRHITREDEHRILTDFISRRSEGSMLVCGNRGVGKTSSVIAATNDVRKQNKRLIPVLIKATSLDYEKGKAPSKESLLYELIRALYKKTRDCKHAELASKTKEVFENSRASEKHDVMQTDESKVTEKTLKGSFPIFPIVMMVIGSIAFAHEFAQYFWILSVSAIVGGALSLLFHYKNTRMMSSSIMSYHRRDYGFSDLQSDFEDLMGEYHSKGYKILFVLDEFDKIGEFDEAVMDMKMLINQGNALFIFITSPDFLDKGINTKRDKKYTLFSQILFLKRPLFGEMERFIDGITHDTSAKTKNDADYKNLRDYLCYESQTDFFDLYRVIRDHAVRKDSDGCLSIKISLDRDQLRKVNLQKSIRWVYERKAYGRQSKQQSNDEMLDALYEFVTRTEDHAGRPDITVNDDSISFSKPEKFAHKHHQLSAVRDLILLLEKQGYLVRKDENVYSVTGKLHKFDTGGVFIEEQRKFKEIYEAFMKNLVGFANIKCKLVEDYGTRFDADTIEAKWDGMASQVNQMFSLDLETAREYYHALQSQESPLIQVDKLDQQINHIKSQTDGLNYACIELLARIFHKRFGKSYTMDSSLDALFNISHPKQHPRNVTLDLQTTSIKHVIVMYHPPVNLLQTIQRSKTTTNNLVICLGSSQLLSEYKKNDFVASDLDDLERKIHAFLNPDRVDGISFMPENDPELKDDEHETFFFALEIPLNLGMLEKLLDMIAKF